MDIEKLEETRNEGFNGGLINTPPSRQVKRLVFMNLIQLIVGSSIFSLAAYSQVYGVDLDHTFNTVVLIIFWTMSFSIDVISLFIWFCTLVRYFKPISYSNGSRESFEKILKDSKGINSKVMIKGGLIYGFVIILLHAVLYNLVFLVNFGSCTPYLPQIQIQNVTYTSTYNWNMGILISNPDERITISYEDFTGFISGCGYSSINIKTPDGLIRQEPKDVSSVMGEWIGRNNDNFNVNIDFKISCRWRFNKFILGKTRNKVRFDCNDLKMEFSSDGNQAKMVGDKALSCSGYYIETSNYYIESRQ